MGYKALYYSDYGIPTSTMVVNTLVKAEISSLGKCIILSLCWLIEGICYLISIDIRCHFYTFIYLWGMALISLWKTSKYYFIVFNSWPFICIIIWLYNLWVSELLWFQYIVLLYIKYFTLLESEIIYILLLRYSSNIRPSRSFYYQSTYISASIDTHTNKNIMLFLFNSIQ